MTVLDEHHDILPVAAPADFGVGSGPAWLDAWLAAHAGELVGWRRSLHAVPELGRAERRTTAFVAAALMAAGLEPRTLPGGTGLVCDVGLGERCVALRADLDALPLQEDTGLPFASTVEGVMHACGHDAHTAMLLGAGLALAAAPNLPGRRAADLPARRGDPARRRDRHGRRRGDGGRRADLRAALRPAAARRAARHQGRTDHVGVRRAGGPAHLAGRAHRRGRTSRPTSSRPSGC